MNGDLGYLLRGAGFAVGGALFWVVYFDLKDRLQPEPRRRLIQAFILGGGSAGLAMILYGVAELLGLPGAPGPDDGSIFAFCVGLVGPIEEGSKFLLAILFVFRWKEFDEPIDGILYASVLAIGFATVENLVYLPRLTWGEQLARAMVSPLSHSLLAAIWGYGVSRGRFRSRTRRGRFLWPAATLALAALIHGLYDFAVFAWHATVLVALVVAVLWAALIVVMRRMLREAEAEAGASAAG